jgi:hypothetical protein
MIAIESVVHWKTSTFLLEQKKIQWRGEARWQSEDGSRYYKWDFLHGEIEVYDRLDRHIAVLNADGSLSEKKPVAGRKMND